MPAVGNAPTSPAFQTGANLVSATLALNLCPIILLRRTSKSSGAQYEHSTRIEFAVRSKAQL